MNAFALTLQLELIIRLLIAGICGCVIGYERKNRNKEAGIRTHIIVSIASCLMMEISKYGFADSGDFDGSRMAAQVVSGIGFLGAGMIFVHKNSVRGLTTAAGVWATSGIGMAIGAGMYVIGVVTTAIIFIFQIFLHKNYKFLRHQNTENLILIIENSKDAVESVRSLMEESGVACNDISIKKLEDGNLRLNISVSVYDNFDIFVFVKRIAAEDTVKAVYNE